MRYLVEQSGGWEGVRLLDFRDGQSSYENNFGILRRLQNKNLTRRQLRDTKLLVRISNIPVSGDHLVIDDSHNSFGSKGIHT